MKIKGKNHTKSNVSCRKCGFSFYATKDLFTPKFLNSGLCLSCYREQEKLE
jgi:hypothetical protein